MNTFDRTVDLSIDLLDRMVQTSAYWSDVHCLVQGEFNDDIINRLDKLEEVNYPGQDDPTNSTDTDYFYDSESSDDSIFDEYFW